MSLARPQLIVLDSSTIGKISRDYWSSESTHRDKARTFVSRLRDLGVYISLTLTHVIEILRHENDSVVSERLKFLRSLPLIAWLRPYDRSWFPGGAPDLLRRELHAVIHEAKSGWRDIVDHVRDEVWETGVGAEMFVDNELLWSAVRTESQHQLLSERYVSSVARTDPGDVYNLTMKQARAIFVRSKEERVPFMSSFAARMKEQLEQHGDRRLENAQGAAYAFASERLDDISQFEVGRGETVDQLLEFHGVPPNLVTDDMTISEVGQLGVFVKQLALLSEGLRPRVQVTVHDVTQDLLPSYFIQQRLSEVQRKAERVSGSDLGDGHIAPLLLYSDGVEVDKRTCEYLTQVQRACPRIAEVKGKFFRAADYMEIANHCQQ